MILFGFNLELWQVGAGALLLLFAMFGLVVALGWLYDRLKEGDFLDEYPGAKAALLKLVFQAITAAYKSSETLFDEISKRLHGTDKYKLALIIYDYLPDTVQLPGMEWWWKDVVSRDRFADLLDDYFEDFEAWWDEAGDAILDHLDPDADDNPVVTIPVVGG